VRIRARTTASAAATEAALASWPAATVDGAVITVDVPEGERSYWSLALCNVVDGLEGRAPTPSAGSTTSVVITAPTDEVFDSLIDPELFERWFGSPLSVELYEGGHWSVDGDPTRTIVELVADKGLLLTDPTGTLRWELSEVDTGTRLTATMLSRNGSPPPRETWLGWLSAIAQLRRLHEIPDRCPIWV
jgi:uncharacterized protein YndB with AHSA1/START domain